MSPANTHTQLSFGKSSVNQAARPGLISRPWAVLDIGWTSCCGWILVRIKEIGAIDRLKPQTMSAAASRKRRREEAALEGWISDEPVFVQPPAPFLECPICTDVTTPPTQPQATADCVFACTRCSRMPACSTAVILSAISAS